NRGHPRVDRRHQRIGLHRENRGRWHAIAVFVGWQPQPGERKELTVTQLDVHRLPITPFVKTRGWNETALRFSKYRARGHGLCPRIDGWRLALVQPEWLQAPGGGLRYRRIERKLDDGQDFLRR